MAAPSRMPVVFVAHGAPLVAIEDARAEPPVAWGRRLPRPTAVLVLSGAVAGTRRTARSRRACVGSSPIARLGRPTVDWITAHGRC